MNKDTTTTNINIDTLFRNNYDNTNATNYLQYLPEPIVNVSSMKLVSSEIPNMWYLLSDNKKSNRFIIDIYNYNVTYDDSISFGNLTSLVDASNNTIIDVETGYTIYYQDIDGMRKYYKIDSTNNIYTDISHNVIVPEGNYMSKDLITTINYIFVNTKNGLDNIVFDIDEVTSRCIFRARTVNDEPNTQPSPFQFGGVYYSPNFKFKITFSNPDEPNRKKYENIGWTFGFINDIYEVDINNIPTFEYLLSRADNKVVTYYCFLKSESSYGRSGMQYIFLEIEDFNNMNKNSDSIISKNGDNKYLSNKILARIPVTDSPNTNMYNDNSDFITKQRTYKTPVTINKIHIRLLDKYGDVIDNNNNDMSFLLEFTRIIK
jgi:hypothetical protein